MSRWTNDDEQEDEEWDEGEDAWDDDDDESAVSECPKCGADIYEDAVRCPLCGEYLTRSTSAWSSKPLWWRLLGIAGIVALIAALTIFAR